MYYISLAEFVNTVYGDLPENETVCIAKPGAVGFHQYPATERKIKQIEQRPDEYYIGVSTVALQDPLRRRKQDCRCAYVVMLDDIGTKCKAPHLAPSVILETSENNYQYLYLLQPYPFDNDDDILYFEACSRALCDAGYADKGTHDICRIYRLPGSINKKEGKNNFETRITLWQPERVWKLNDLITQLGLKPIYKTLTRTDYDGELPEGIKDPIMEWLSEQGILGERRDDFFDIKCPWSDKHTTGKDTAGYSPLGYGHPKILRTFHCFHAHCAERTAKDFLEWVQAKGGPGVEISGVQEVNKTVIQQQIRELSNSERIQLIYASMPKIWKANLPDAVLTSNGVPKPTQLSTRLNIQYVMDILGVKARMNMQTHKTEFAFNNKNLQLLIDHDDELIRVVLDITQKIGIGTGHEGVVMKVANEAGLNSRYHPMAKWVKSKRWDGTRRFNQLCDAVAVKDRYATIWPIYFRRWLIQCMQAVMGWRKPKQMRGCLVLQGRQGVGKTRFLASLVPPDFFLEGAHLELHGSAAKDSIMQTTAYPIVELGELETTFSKSAVGQLKAFMSLKKDTYRSPYDVRARDWPRCTSFCGTVNKMDFLMDETGSSRYWPVAIDFCNPEHGIDMQQLWAEVFTWWSAGEPWWLAEQEDIQRAEQAEAFEVTTDTKELIQEWLAAHTWGKQGTAMNATAFAKLIGVPTSHKNLSSIRQYLTKYLGDPKTRLRGVQNAWDIPTTPGKNIKFS